MVAQQSVDAQTYRQAVFVRLEVDIGGLHVHRFFQEVVHQLDHRLGLRLAADLVDVGAVSHGQVFFAQGAHPTVFASAQGAGAQARQFPLHGGHVATQAPLRRLPLQFPCGPFGGLQSRFARKCQ